MAANVYEGMFILDSNRFGRDSDAVAGQIQEIVEKVGGQLLVHRLWEERRLAYPIKGQRKGTYWLTYFRLDSNQLVAVRRQFQLSENILRMLILKVDPRIVDHLVAHAQSATFTPTPDAAAPAAVVVEEEVAGVAIDDEIEIEEEDV